MRTLRSKWVVVGLLVALILAGFVVFMPRSPKNATQESPPQETQVQETQAQETQVQESPSSEPQAQATKAAQGNRVDMFSFLAESKLDLTPYKGKALFLNFFTEWCPYCMQEMPDIKKVYETYSQDELQIILVHVWDGEDEKNSESIRQKYGLGDLTFFEDQDKGLSRMVGLPGYPTSFFIDREGYLVKGIPSALSFEQMAETIDSMGISKAEVSQ